MFRLNLCAERRSSYYFSFAFEHFASDNVDAHVLGNNRAREVPFTFPHLGIIIVIFSSVRLPERVFLLRQRNEVLALPCFCFYVGRVVVVAGAVVPRG